ncbi:MAG TPA: DUF3563 family protein [Pararobbsia sp.]|jgi:hypothetical protein|nr:DUF3563 family protein [Pararobbsia sp.]
MLDHLFEKLGKAIERAANERRDAYLASSTDLTDLDRRMRTVESEGLMYPHEDAYGPHTDALPRDRSGS